MRGEILVFQDNKGIISGHDGNRYHFVKMEWTGTKDPVIGQEVDFSIEGENAKNIFILSPQPKSKSHSYHSKAMLAVVCFLIGFLGIHRFMVGKIGTGIVMLILSITLLSLIPSILWSFIAASIWPIIDLVLILAEGFTDKDGNKIT